MGYMISSNKIEFKRSGVDAVVYGSHHHGPCSANGFVGADSRQSFCITFKNKWGMVKHIDQYFYELDKDNFLKKNLKRVSFLLSELFDNDYVDLTRYGQVGVAISDSLGFDDPRHVRRRYLENINSLYIKSDLTDLDGRVFKHFKSLKGLCIQRLEFTHFSSNQLIGLEDIEKITFESSEIDYLNNDTFRHLKKLRTLSFYKSKIHNVYKNSFRGLDNLDELKIMESDVNFFDKGNLVGLDGVRILNLSLSNFSDYCGLPYAGLHEIYIQKEQLEETFNLIKESNDKTIIKIDDGMPWEEFITYNYDYNKRKMIDISGWRSFGECVANYLCQFSIIEKVDAQELCDIKELTISDELTDCKPEMLEYFKSLEKLSIVAHSKDTLEDIVEIYTKVKSLKYLKIHLNNISKISAKSFHQLKKLETLIISSSALKNIDKDAFVGLDSLKKLEINYYNEGQRNHLINISENSFAGIENLNEFSIDSCESVTYNI